MNQFTEAARRPEPDHAFLQSESTAPGEWLGFAGGQAGISETTHPG